MPDFCPLEMKSNGINSYWDRFLLFSHFVEINTRFYEPAGNRINRKLFKTALIVLSSFRYFNKQLLAAFWNSYS